MGAVTSVKDQGTCNSCWAFSTIAVLEGAHFKANNELLELSAQQLIDCSTDTCDSTDEKKGSKKCNKGCKGGYREVAFKYIKDYAGGVMKADDYSSAEKDNKKCFKKSDNDERSVASVKEYSKIEANVDQYASYLYHHGPLAVKTDLEYDQTYKVPNLGLAPVMFNTVWYPSSGESTLGLWA
ncbi:hypothetical protein QYF36_017938 [Acer negundo]|nr:hypothetical protein QYF36_017938 [Acer negundo]